MKLLSTILAALWPLFCYPQDWQLTVHQNLVTDLRQTMSFRSWGVKELNPLYQVGERELPAVFALMSVLAADHARKEPEMWKWWGIAQFLVVGSNYRFGRQGIPVLSFRF